MPTPRIRVYGLKELQRQFRRFPQEYKREVKRTLKAGLLVLQEKVPAYPAQPLGSTYERTGQLGRSLGNSESGSRVGSADVQRIDGVSLEATFGSNTVYAEDVIGEGTQKPIFRRIGWWTVRDIAKNAERKLVQLFNDLADDLAAFLDRNV